MSEEFKREVAYVKSRWPNLEEHSVKSWIKINMISQDKTSVEKSLGRLKVVLSSYPHLLEEALWLNESISSFKESCMQEEIDESYLTLKKGSFHEEQVYHRKFHPMGGMDFFTLKWSINKANQIVKTEEISKEFFPINKMNIDEQELEKPHLKNALHNKKPGILITYEPYDGEIYNNFLIDGSHRVTANKIFRNKTTYPIYRLDTVQSINSLRHPYYKCFYLLHLFLGQFHTPDKLSLIEMDIRYQKYLDLKNKVL